MAFLKNLFITDRFFYLMAVLTLLMMLSYAFPPLFPLVKVCFPVMGVLCITDTLLLFNKRVDVSVRRVTGPVFSLGDENQVQLDLLNKSGLKLDVEVIDELPEQFQIRDFSFHIILGAFASAGHKYHLRPTTRGEYWFGRIHLYLTSPLGMMKRRISSEHQSMVPVYPSIIQMKNMS